ncbi:MAG TPA: Sec-independent protein translocase protein TatB [Pyrinomonadaceae bacterium]
MYLLILESIGTSELILIGIIALIVFGPRKLPQMAKTIGKTMADFRRTTNEFKTTWEQEAEFYKEELTIQETNSVSENSIIEEKTIARTISIERKEIEAPEIKEVEQEKIDKLLSSIKNKELDSPKEEKTDFKKPDTQDKREWL